MATTNKQSVSINFLGIDLTVVGVYYPGTLRPFCDNPDSSAFSDPGEPSQFEIETVYVTKCGDAVDLYPMLESLMNITTPAYTALEMIEYAIIEKLEF